MLIALLAGLTAGSAADCRQLPAPPVTTALANDNRVPAGRQSGNVLTVRLVARAVAWRPEGTSGCGLAVHAFAEEGRPALIPGPLLRVRTGTELRVTVRNTLPATIWLRGLQGRSAAALDSTAVEPGTSRELRFTATTPGAWYYWAGGAGASVPGSGADGQLVGALVVDSAGGRPPGGDRVLVLTRWNPSGGGQNTGFQVNAFNGRSWPATERLHYTVGDSVRWHVINASNGIHEMHLHGFYFRLDAKGFSVDTPGIARPGIGGLRVTAVLRPGEWLSMSWSPDRPGNWLYHCHLLAHMSADQHLDRMPGTAPPATGRHSMDEMGGLVLGLEIRPARNAVASAPPAPRRSIDIYTGSRPGRFGDRPGYGFVVQEGPNPPAPDSIPIPVAPLILTRGEPVRITVHNRLAVPIGVHWHGIELDSYFDGVGGFSGLGRRIAPMIAPGDSFVVAMTPPRAGTFMYHVHGESGEELASGLYAPLLVLEPGTSYDRNTERFFVVADGGPGEGRPIAVNGQTAPDTVELVAGTRYRLRLMYISANDVYFTTLRGAEGPVPGRLIAFDGHDVPAGQVQARPLRYPAGPGHTYDYEFTPGSPGNLSLEVQRFVYDTGIGVERGPVTAVPIRVRAP